jgi:hypothetical protein
MSNTVYDRWELMNNITTCEIDKQHHQFTNHRFIAQSGIGDAAGAQVSVFRVRPRTQGYPPRCF